MTPKKLLLAGLAQIGVEAEERSVDQLLRFGIFLLDQNKMINLTAIKEPDEVVTKHFLDCAYLLRLLQPGHKRVVDIGTGAGFPGIPLKLLRPELDVTLLDSLGKRVRFLQAYAEAEKLQGTWPVHARAEDYAHKQEREGFDYAVCRAVAQLSVLCELCLPLVKPGGEFLAMKGTDCAEEIEDAKGALKLLGGEISRLEDYTIPFTEITHRIVVIRKVKETPADYPRRSVKVMKHPLTMADAEAAEAKAQAPEEKPA